MHWTFYKSSFIGEEQIGPIANVAFLEEIRSGNVTSKTLVHSPTATNGQWVYASSVPMIQNVLEKIQNEELVAKEAKKYSAAEKKAAAAQGQKLGNSKLILIAACCIGLLITYIPIVRGCYPDNAENAEPFQVDRNRAVEKIKATEEKPMVLEGGARHAGMELAKKFIGEQGVFPTRSIYPWSSVKAELLRDTGQFKIYKVTGTVESGSRSASWTALLLSNGESFACTAVYVDGNEIWALPEE